jgi:beta-phosphoglucomutase-like phosphatase (HAD superfamily)
MIICVDFDNCVIQPCAFDASHTEMKLVPGAVEALQQLRKAGHLLVLYSARANRSLRDDPFLNPLIRTGAIKLDRARWEAEAPAYRARYRSMLTFLADNLPHLFHSIDDGSQGKPDADLFLEGLGRTMDHHGGAWRRVMHAYGETEDDDAGVDSQEEAVRGTRDR